MTAGYVLTIFGLRMALRSFRLNDLNAYRISAVPILLASSAIDWRDLLGALSLFCDGCRRRHGDPKEMLEALRDCAETKGWQTVEAFFSRELPMQAPRVMGMDPFDAPHSFQYRDLRLVT